MQDKEYLQAHAIIVELEAKVARLESENAEFSLPQIEAKIARLQAKLAAKKAETATGVTSVAADSEVTKVDDLNATATVTAIEGHDTDVIDERPAKKSRATK